MAPGGAKRWVYTLNNPTEDEEQYLFGDVWEKHGPDSDDHRLVYHTAGRETGEENTPHFQGFVIFNKRTNLTWLKNHFNERAHFEIARGTNTQARDYSQKDDDYEEFGEVPDETKVGQAAIFEEYKNWCKALDHQPSEKEIADAYPHLWCRYRRSVTDMARMFAPQPNIQSGELRGWQIELKEKLDGEPNDRTIIFCIDKEGQKGKSFFCRWMISKYPDKVQVLGPAKRDDLAHVVDTERSIFLMNVPRGSMEHLNYGFLESLKDRMILSPKYESTMKFMKAQPHIVVFANEDPDETKMTEDRYDFFNFNTNN